MQTTEICHTVTSKGHFYYINGKRVSREAVIEAKHGRRQDCFVTRATKKAVRNYSTVYVA